MLSLRNLLLVALPLVSAVLAQAEPHSTKRAVDNGRDPQTFHELLNAVPEESLHAVLDNHMRPKYQKGVFEYDKKALEKVHDDNPSLASKLVIYAAKLELLKRQNTNATVSSTPSETPAPPTTTTTIGSTSGEGTPTSTGNKETSQTPEPSGSTAAPTSSGDHSVASSTHSESSASPEPTPTISVPVPVTTTDSAGKVITTSTPRPAIVISTTNSEGKATIITTPSPTSGQPITATDAKGSTFVTTYTPGGGLVSSLVVLTTTLPNGDVATITSYQIVNGNPTGSAAGSNSNPSATRGSPGLQSGAANVLSRQWGVEAAALVGGAMGVAWML